MFLQKSYCYNRDTGVRSEHYFDPSEHGEVMILDFGFCEKLRGRVSRLEQTFQDRFWIDVSVRAKPLVGGINLK